MWGFYSLLFGEIEAWPKKLAFVNEIMSKASIRNESPFHLLFHTITNSGKGIAFDHFFHVPLVALDALSYHLFQSALTVYLDFPFVLDEPMSL